jgi:hypothetical protein
MRSVPPRSSGSSLKGCQIVAGGRSVAQITGKESPSGPYPGGVPPFFWHPFRVWTYFRLLSGGLRSAPTTGYCLTALQAAEARPLPQAVLTRGLVG